jgi:hypothetical protein
LVFDSCGFLGFERRHQIAFKGIEYNPVGDGIAIGCGNLDPAVWPVRRPGSFELKCSLPQKRMIFVCGMGRAKCRVTSTDNYDICI